MHPIHQLQLLSIYLFYMFGLILSFFLAFWIMMKYAQNYSLKTRIKYSITAGLLTTKFVILAATLLGIDKTLLIIRIGIIRIPITANLLLFIGNLLATLSLNWERINKYLTITEEEYQQLYQ